MNYVRRELPNGLTLHTLLTPRYEVSNFGLDYTWEQINVNLNPITGNSIVEVTTKYHKWRPFLVGWHIGILPFPCSWVSDITAEREKAMLLLLMQRIHDPTSVITDLLNAD